MTRNNKQLIDKENNLLKMQADRKISWWHRLVRFGKLFGEVGEYVFDEQQHADRIKQDILRIERERQAEQEKLDEKRHPKLDVKKTGFFQKKPVKQASMQASAADKLRLLSQDAHNDENTFLSILNNDKPNLSFESAPELSAGPVKNTPLANSINTISLPEAVKSVPTPVQVPIIPVPVPELAPKKVEEILDNKPKQVKKTLWSQIVAWFKPNPKLPKTKEINPLQTAFVKPEIVKPEIIKPEVFKPEIKKPEIFNDHKHKLAKHLAQELLTEIKQFTKNEVENRYWQSFNMMRANLIKEQRSMFFNWRRKMLMSGFFVSLSVLLVLLAYGALLIFQQKKSDDNVGLSENLASINKQINAEQSKMDEISNFNNRLIYVSYLLDNHIYWTNFFKLLENRTMPQVYYQSFQGDLTGVYKIPTVAKNFSVLTIQTQVLIDTDGLVTAADPQDAKAFQSASSTVEQAVPVSGPLLQTAESVLRNGNVTFDLNLTIKPELVLIKPDEAIK